MENVIGVGMGRNRGVSLENGGFSDQFCKSIVCMRETEVCTAAVCLLPLNMAGVDCGGGRMWCEQY